MTTLLSTPSILLVEDNAPLCDIMQIYLGDVESNVVTCTCGSSALRFLTERMFDVMIFDVMLPGVSGLELLRKVRSFSTNPVIITSALAAFRAESFALGADLFFVKPVRLQTLVDAVRTFLTDPI